MTGKTYIKHIPQQRIKASVDSGKLVATTDFQRISECHAILIAVPTPLTAHHEPDMSFIVSTARLIAPYIHANQLIVSTVPGTAF